MAKRLCIIAACIVVLLLYANSRTKQEEVLQHWDCSVLCAQDSSEDSYVITYSDQKIVSKTGALTFETRNDFDIVVHLLADGEEERVHATDPYSVSTWFQIKKDTVYTVGVHADVEEGTEIKLWVFDGKSNVPWHKP